MTLLDFSSRYSGRSLPHGASAEMFTFQIVYSLMHARGLQV